MKFKFKRYKVYHKGKPYYVLIPDGIKDNLWIVDWADWWYGSFVTGSLKAIKILAACFAVLGFNPYVIIYLPVGHDKVPDGLSGHLENGKYDIMFKTNRVPLKDKDWKVIRNKLKKTQWATYKFKFDEERVKQHFNQKSQFVEYVDQEKILKNAGASTRLAVGTAIFTFPRAIYEREARNTWDWVTDDLVNEDWQARYRENGDYMTCPSGYFCYGGYEKKKFTYEEPGCTFLLEVYDINIINRYVKEKRYLVEPARVREREQLKRESQADSLSHCS